MNHLPIDPHADGSRRAWLPCPNCDDQGRDCNECRHGRNCQEHWRYLITNEVTRVSLQCPTCTYFWTVDTAQARRSERDVGETIHLGSRARHLVLSPDGDHLYATTENSVGIVDRTRRAVASIPIGVDPKRTLVSPDGSRVYVVGHDGAMSIIDTANHTVKTVLGKTSTAEVVSRDDNYLYLVHNEGRNSWASVMGHDGTTATVVPVDSYACALALSPDGGRLYVASSKPKSSRQHGHGSISVIDTATFTLIDVIAMRSAPDTLAVSPDGSTVYVTHYNRSAISAIDLASGALTLIELEDAPLEIAVSPDGDQLYVTNLHSLSLIDTATNLAETLPIGDLPRHLRISSDGKRVYVCDLGHQTLWVLDSADKAIITTIDLGLNPVTVSTSADDDFLYIADSSSSALDVVSLAAYKAGLDRDG